MKKEILLVLSVTIAVFAVLFWLAYLGLTAIMDIDGDGFLANRKSCMDKGYMEAYTFSDVVYCTRRINGTDQVVPLSDLRRE